DGIRGLIVTGVQTCALPICDGVEVERLGHVAHTGQAQVPEDALDQAGDLGKSGGDSLSGVGAEEPVHHRQVVDAETLHGLTQVRSEERRVGKEGRSWWGVPT